jgi:hypothetical protein
MYLLCSPAPAAFSGRQRRVGNFDYREASFWSNDNVWRGLHGQTNHRNFDFFGAGVGTARSPNNVPTVHLPIAGPYPELRPFLPFAPSDGAVRSLGRSMGL